MSTTRFVQFVEDILIIENISIMEDISTMSVASPGALDAYLNFLPFTASRNGTVKPCFRSQPDASSETQRILNTIIFLGLLTMFVCPSKVSVILERDTY